MCEGDVLIIPGMISPLALFLHFTIMLSYEDVDWSDPWVMDQHLTVAAYLQESNFHFHQLRSFNWFYCQAVKKFTLYLTEVESFRPSHTSHYWQEELELLWVLTLEDSSEIRLWHWHSHQLPLCIINLEVMPNQAGKCSICCSFFPDVPLYDLDNDVNVHDDHKLLSQGDMTMTLG